MKRVLLAIPVVLWTLASTGAAEARPKIGDDVYIQTKNAQVYAQPKGSKVATLQPGKVVKWLGKSNPSIFYKIEFVEKGSKKNGVVRYTCLSATNKTQPVILTKSKLNTSGAASSTAGIKALGSGPERLAEASGPEAEKALRHLKILNKMANKVTPKVVAKHAKKNNLAENVGADE